MPSSLIYRPTGKPVALSVTSAQTATVQVAATQNENCNYAAFLNPGTTQVFVALCPAGGTVPTITFPASTSGPEVETYVGIGTASSGAGVLLWFGQLTASLTVNNGITPSIAASALSITES